MNNGWAIPSSVAIIAFVLSFSIGLGPVSSIVSVFETYSSTITCVMQVTWVVIGDVMPSSVSRNSLNVQHALR